MKAKIEQTQNKIVSKIKNGNKESALIQKTEDNRTQFIYEEKEGNIITRKIIEYIF